MAALLIVLIYKDGEAEPQGIKITARYAGTGVIYTAR